MSTTAVILMCVSFCGLLFISVYRFLKFKDKRNFIAQLLILSLSFGVLFYLFYESGGLVGMGNDENNENNDTDIYFVIVLYLCMLLGMLAQYGHTRYSRPKRRRRKFDLGVFFAPVCASPIVFIPLLAALQNADIDLMKLTAAKMMVFFVAFENGFFWKDYFDNRQKEREHDEKQSRS